MKRERCFALADAVEWRDIEAQFPGALFFVAGTPAAFRWVIYDTFDWRLFGRGFMLRQSGSAFTLAPLAGGKILSGDNGVAQPVFVRDFPDGNLRATLEPIVKERALLPLAEVLIEETTYRVLNAQQKTVARLLCSRVRMVDGVAEAPLSTYVCMRLRRKFTDDARPLLEMLTEAEEVETRDTAVYLRALLAAGHVPKGYSSRLDVQLDPAMRADEAAKVILRRLLETMRANEAGIIADIDTEYLHDYRVAVRRARSLLSQLRHVFPVEQTAPFKQGLRDLGSLTGELRDLDVFLLTEPDYRAMLPEALRDDLVPLFDLLRARRIVALERVVQGLSDERYLRFISYWEEFLDAPLEADASARNAAVPIIDLARRRIYRRYRRIVRDGTYILDHTEDQLLHDLRLECKRLRYLLEFFDGLYPRKRIARLVTTLKRLQDTLGSFTDLAVQQEALLALAEQLPTDDDLATRRTLIAVGVLIQLLANEQQTVKAEFAGRFARFASPASRRRYRALFDRK